MTREEAIKIAREEYERTQTNELNALKRRENEAVQADGEIRTLLNERAALPMRALRLAMNNPEGAKAVSEKMREEGLKINAEIRMRLVSAGFPENHKDLVGRTFLEPHCDSHDRNEKDDDNQDGYKDAACDKITFCEK